MAFRALLRQHSRYFPMRFDLITSIQVKVERKLERFETQMEREWNANGSRMDCKWSANGTRMERIYERVPNAFPVRLF